MFFQCFRGSSLYYTLLSVKPAMPNIVESNPVHLQQLCVCPLCAHIDRVQNVSEAWSVLIGSL